MLLEEQDLTQRIHKESLLEKIRSEERNIQALLTWSQSPRQPLGWRATWILRQVLRENDPLLSPHIQAILASFSTFNESQKREWLKALEHQQLDEDHEGILFDLSVREWRNIHNHPALRASAIMVVFRLLTTYPELKNELNHLMTEEYIETLSPGIQKSVMKRWHRF